MMKKGSLMSIGAQSFWGKVFVGGLWIAIGITNMFDGTVMSVIHTALLLVGVFDMVFLCRTKVEKTDEMADYNYMKAKAKTRDVMHYVYCVGAILTALVFGLLQKFDIVWPKVISSMFFVLMGIQDLTTGLIFRRLEAE